MESQMPKGFLKVDKNIQIVLGAIMGCCIVYFPLMSLPFFVLGVWQLISAFYLAFGFNSRSRKIYLLVILGWAVMLGLMVFVEIYGVLFYALLFLIPLCIAIWYFNMTYHDWKSSMDNPEKMDDILDYEMDEL